MPKISFNISDDILFSLNETEQELSKKVKLYAAMELFREHKLTIGQSASMANMYIDDFMVECGKHGIPVIDYDPSELLEELKRF